MIRVKVVAPFAIRAAGPDGEVELPDSTTVRQLAWRLRAPLYAYALPISVNGRQAELKQTLQPGDLIIFLMPRAGG